MDIPETASIGIPSYMVTADSCILQGTALKAHLHQLVSIYQRVTLVNLVNHKGHELPVKEAFERNMASASASDPTIAANVKYVYFDFHTECKGMRFDRISRLIDRISPSLNQAGWFHSTAGETVQDKVLSKQTGVVRSNCMDCLDRTNVSQSALGKWTLTKQLRSAGVLSLKETVEDHPEFMIVFRNGESSVSNRSLGSIKAHHGIVWADHGDTVSCAYAGTGALKSDYTRTGKRSREGLLQDGYNSLMRYAKNNFFDGDRQVSACSPQTPLRELIGRSGRV